MKVQPASAIVHSNLGGTGIVPPRKFQFGLMACSTHTIGQLLDELEQLLADKSLQPRTILCLNAHIYNVAFRDLALRQWLNQARVTAADGMAIVWAARLFGVGLPERCNMTEAFTTFLQDAERPPSRAVLVGCSEQEAAAAAQKSNQISGHCRIIQSYSGYLVDDEYGKIFSARPDIDFILLGMGTPKTERIAQIAARSCPEAIIWGIGGGTVRIYAGSMKEAPAAWRRLGLQWLYRLGSNPAALWRRYLIGLPLFAVRVGVAKWRRPERRG